MTRFLFIAVLMTAGCTRAFEQDPRDDDDPGDTADTADTADDDGIDTGDEDPTGDECPPGVTCIDSFPWVGSASTTGGSSDFDQYSCSPSTSESGPEVLYRLDIAQEGFVALSLEGLPSGVDVDVHLLDARDPSACIDRGHWRAGALLPPGRYWVVVDSWTSGSEVYDGDYTLVVGHSTPAALAASGLDAQVASAALHAFDVAWFEGDTDRFQYMVIDFSLPSYERRLWVFDLTDTTLLFNELVSHGENSGDPSDRAMASSFSNTDGSHQSSLGVMVTAETYSGSKGYSMRLDGLEPGFNSNVRSRAIVVHPATYATQDFVDSYGYLGRSWGCPAVDPDISSSLIDTVKNGTLMITWYPDSSWINTSSYLAGWSR